LHSKENGGTLGLPKTSKTTTPNPFDYPEEEFSEEDTPDDRSISKWIYGRRKG